MKSYTKFKLFAGLSISSAMVLVCALGYGFWKSLAVGHPAGVQKLVLENWGYGAAAMIGVLGIWGGWFWYMLRFYILPTAKLADELPVIFSANPSHRIRVNGAPDVQRLADLINEGADRYQYLKRGIDEKIRHAAKELEQEKDILASIISCFSEGIVVCKPSGAILLFNRQAEEFLSSKTDPHPEALTGQFIGLGRNISCVINGSQIADAVSEITEKLSCSSESPGTCFAIMGPNGHFLKVEITPILSHARELVGFIMRINAIAQPNSGKISLSLSDGLERLETGIASIGTSHYKLHLIPTAIQNVLEMVQGRARENYGIGVNLKMPGNPEWIYADNPYLISSLTFLLDQIRRSLGITEFTCCTAIEKDYIDVDMIWTGPPIANAVLEKWNQRPVIHESDTGYLKLHDILMQHEAEWWSSPVHQEPEKASLRIFFPSAEPYRVRSILPVTLSSRPEFYDFDLLNRPDASPALQQQLLSNITYTVLDTETTGLDPLSDEIISIGAVRIVNGRLLRNEIFNILVNPQREFSGESIKIHGIRPEMLRDQPTIDKALPLFHQFTQNTVLVGHNVAFDMRMFQVKEHISDVRFTQPILDTMFLSAVIHPSHRDHSLEAIAERLGITITGRHTALGDALASAEIFLKCVPILARNGVLTLNDAIRASMKTKYGKIY